jgi:2-isopropylmalate synthase
MSAAEQPAGEHVRIFDTTLRDGEESPGATIAPADRLRIAEMLAEAKVDCIEAGFPAASAITAASVAEIARRVRSTSIAAVARCTYGDIEAAAAALHDAAAPRIHVVVATSDLHLSKKLRITREAALERVTESVRFARRFTDDIEFSAEDASRSDLGFVSEVFAAAIRAGATTVSFPDTVGYATPDDMTAAITAIREKTEGIEKAVISVHTHNDLGLATANALAAVKAGARQVECTINGIGERAGNCALEEVVSAFYVRRDVLPYTSGVVLQRLAALSRAVAAATRMPVQKNKAIVGANAFVHESGIHQDGLLKDRRTYEILDAAIVGATTILTISRNSGRHAIVARAHEIGCPIGEADERAFAAAVIDFSQTRTIVTDNDLIHIAARVLGDRIDPSPANPANEAPTKASGETLEPVAV